MEFEENLKRLRQNILDEISEQEEFFFKTSDLMIAFIKLPYEKAIVKEICISGFMYGTDRNGLIDSFELSELSTDDLIEILKFYKKKTEC